MAAGNDENQGDLNLEELTNTTESVSTDSDNIVAPASTNSSDSSESADAANSADAADSAVARIGKEGYATLEAAITAAGSGNAAVVNFPGASATLNGGTYMSYNWYVIKNHGTVEIDGAVTVTTDNGVNPWF